MAAILFGACAIIQIVLGVFALSGQHNSTSLIDNASLQTEVENLKSEIATNRDVHNTLRNSFDEYNSQVCHVSGWCENEFQQLLDKIFSPTRAKIDRVLGVKDRVYSIELFLDSELVPDYEFDWDELTETPKDFPKLGATNLQLRYFFGSERVSQTDALGLGERHPAVLAWSTHVSDEYPITKHQNIYGTHENQSDNVYFNRVLTAPVRVVCEATDYWGVLVLTTQQISPLSDDAIDNFQWLSTLTTNFIAEYNKCIHERREELTSQRRSRGQQERRERERAAAEPEPADAAIAHESPQDNVVG